MKLEYTIKEYLGDCQSDSVAKFVQKPGKKTSYNRAIKAILMYDSQFYHNIGLDYPNPWDDKTKIIEHRNHHFLVLVHSAIEYLFEIRYEKDNPT